MPENTKGIPRKFAVFASSFDTDKAARLIAEIEKKTQWKHEGNAERKEPALLLESMIDAENASVVIIISSGNAVLHCLAGFAHALHKPVLVLTKSYSDRWNLPLGIPVDEKGEGITAFLWGIEFGEPNKNPRWKAHHNLRAEADAADAEATD